jgi:hypothetical protein
MRSSHIVCGVLMVGGCWLQPGRAAAQGPAPQAATGLVQEVRLATEAFRDPAAAEAAGYASTGTCVSGPERGAMGVHYANGALIEDGILDAQRPELLLYEVRGSKARLLGVEFLVIAEAWHAHTAAPPALMGQHFHYVGSPNRYGLPPFYELHVWAWIENTNGMFVDWNPAVSCEAFVPDAAATTAGHHSGAH